MAEVVMSYIIIEKSDEEKSVEQLATEYLRTSGFEIIENKIVVNNESAIDFEIKHKRNSSRFYIKLVSNMRIQQGIEVLQKLDDCLFKTDFRKHVDLLRDYDGISQALSEKLYPKYAKFERRLRQLILLVLTKALGNNWINETISEDELKDLKSKARGNLTVTNALEQLDLAQMESYLFDKREVDYQSYLKDKLSKEQLEKLEKEDIINVIDEMRPKSLWERNFCDVGSQEKWENKIHEIHDCRNKVAHHKYITQEEYRRINRKLNQLNNDLLESIQDIQDKDFTNQSAIDILGNFVLLTARLVNTVFNKYDYSEVLSGINNVVQNLVKPIANSYQPALTERLQQISQPMIDASNITRAAEEFAQTASAFSALNTQAFVMPKIPNISLVDAEALGMAEKVNEIARNFNPPLIDVSITTEEQ